MEYLRSKYEQNSRIGKTTFFRSRPLHKGRIPEESKALQGEVIAKIWIGVPFTSVQNILLIDKFLVIKPKTKLKSNCADVSIHDDCIYLY